MSNKNKTVSFRVNEDTFGHLRDIADEQDLSLSSVFREYVDEFVAHDGRVEAVPAHDARGEASADDDAFPRTVSVPTSLVREHERLELECDHLREQLDEYKRHASTLEAELEAEEEMVRLEDVDFEVGTGLQVE